MFCVGKPAGGRGAEWQQMAAPPPSSCAAAEKQEGVLVRRGGRSLHVDIASGGVMSRRSAFDDQAVRDARREGAHRDGKLGGLAIGEYVIKSPS